MVDTSDYEKERRISLDSDLPDDEIPEDYEPIPGVLSLVAAAERDKQRRREARAHHPTALELAQIHPEFSGPQDPEEITRLPTPEERQEVARSNIRNIIQQTREMLEPPEDPEDGPA